MLLDVRDTLSNMSPTSNRQKPLNCATFAMLWVTLFHQTARIVLELRMATNTKGILALHRLGDIMGWCL